MEMLTSPDSGTREMVEKELARGADASIIGLVAALVEYAHTVRASDI